MKETILHYLEQNYECVFDSMIDSGIYFFRDKTNGEELSLYQLKGVIDKIFAQSSVYECCDKFYENKKPLAIDTLPFKMVTNNKIIHYVKTWEDVCKMHGIKPESVLIEGLTPSEIAGRKLKLIIKVLNEDWIPKHNERTYEIVWNRLSDGSFSYDLYNAWSTYSHVRVGLLFKNEILAKYCAEQFIDLWNEYLRYDTNELLLTIKNVK